MILADSEFGEIIVRRNALAKNISFSRSTSGRLQMSVPSYVTERQIQKSLDSMRDRLRDLNLADPATQRARDTQKKLLMKQAKEYLPYRLEYLAKRYGYHYDISIIPTTPKLFGRKSKAMIQITAHTVKCLKNIIQVYDIICLCKGNLSLNFLMPPRFTPVFLIANSCIFRTSSTQFIVNI